ncbi:pancreatic secretory granule membrane major glycoprotein GP2-like [Trichomycterus rosablanca]|uniref:pancreatic secretory granule membrane major glycoprotein GP2-like n=1 Tax=Trichomycterus rosablanca TaxID=2290929 RepID=UPI002F35D437
MYYNSVSNITGIISNNAGLYLSISCVYPLIQKLTAPKSFLIVGSIIMKNIPAAEGTYQVLMEAYPDNSFTTPYNGSVTFNMNQEIFMGVTVVGFDSTKITTVLDSCWATPTDNINDTVRWNLITNECPDPMESSVTVLQNGVSTSSRFSFNMFTFTNSVDSIHLHCQVHLCLLGGNNCALPCGIKRRRRRAEEFHDTAAITMSF